MSGGIERHGSEGASRTEYVCFSDVVKETDILGCLAGPFLFC